MKEQTPNSFRRRKLIEEMAPQRKADQRASAQTDELSNISQQMADSQSASELIAETIENKGNQVLTGLQQIDKRLEDVVEAGELAAEASEKGAEASRTLTAAMSEKLNKLTSLLGEKLSGTTSPAQNTTESTSLQAIKDAMPIEVEQPKLQELLEKLVPQHNQPTNDEDFPALPSPETPHQENSKEGKEKGDMFPGMEDLLKTTKAGFKATISITDRIAGMLFKYTVTALAEAAKMAGMIFGVVLAIDSIRVYFQYFQKKFDESWSEFDKKFEEWGPLISDLMTMAKNISVMFKDGDWPGLAKAIFNGIGNITTSLADMILLGMSKLTASILRTFGKDDMALSVEGSALQGFQDRTGAKLDRADQMTLAKYQDKQDQEKTQNERQLYKKWKDKPHEGLDQAVKYGSIDEKTAEKIKNNSFDFTFQEKPEQERLEAIAKRNESYAAIKRTTDRNNQIASPDESDVKNSKEMKTQIDKQLAEQDKSVPQRLNTDMLLKKLDDSIVEFNKRAPVVKPAPVQQSDDSQQVQRIEQAEKAKAERQKAPEQGTTLQQTNIMQKTSKTSYNMPPQSSTPAPGMARSLHTN